MSIESLEANRRAQCDSALKQMEIALAILDHVGGRSDVGAHLDLAICRLRVLPNRMKLANLHFRSYLRKLLNTSVADIRALHDNLEKFFHGL